MNNNFYRNDFVGPMPSHIYNPKSFKIKDFDKEFVQAISSHKAKVFLISSFSLAILYTICFAQIEILPQASFTVFWFATCFLTNYVLKKNELLINKKANMYLVVILVFSFANILFTSNIYLNVIIVLLTYFLYVVKATNINLKNILDERTLISVLENFIVNIKLATESIKNIFNKKYLKNSKYLSKNIKFSILGVVLASPIIIIIFSLLVSSDMVFAYFTENFVNIFEFDFFNGMVYILNFVFSFIIFLSFLYKVEKNKLKKPSELIKININSYLVFPLMIILNLLYATFSVVQFSYLFFGEFFTLPDDMTYANYSREGFFQLLAITLINILIIYFIVRITNLLKESKFIRFLIFGIYFFTSILIISSFYRIVLYISAYGFTTLRLQVFIFLIFEFIVLILSLIKILGSKINFPKSFLVMSFAFYFLNIYFCNNVFVTEANHFFYKKEVFKKFHYVIEKENIFILDKYENELENEDKEIIGYIRDSGYDSWQNYAYFVYKR